MTAAPAAMVCPADAQGRPASAPEAPAGPIGLPEADDAPAGQAAPFAGRSEAEALAMFQEHRGLPLWTLRRYFPDALRGSCADDVRQVAEVALWRAAVTYDPAKGAFSTWAVRLIRQAAINELRRHRPVLGRGRRKGEGIPVVFVGDGLEEMPVEDRGETLDDRLHRSELRRAMAAALADLRPADRAAVLRNVAEGETQENIAGADAVSRQRVSQRVAAGLERLRDDERLQAFSGA